MPDYSFTEQQVAELESRFGLKFPADYRRCLLKYPFERMQEEFVGATRRSMLDAGFSEDEAVEDLVEFNASCREKDPCEFPWKKHYWWIGGDGAGGFFFLDCSDPESPVYYFDHEECAMDFTDKQLLKPRSIADYVSKLLKDEADRETLRQTMKEKIANRKWWQFWVPKKPPSWLK